MPTPQDPQAFADKLCEILNGINTGRTRFCVAVFCLEGDGSATKLPSGIIALAHGAQGGFIRLTRNDADPAEVEKCVREAAGVLTAELERAKRISS